MFSPCKPSQNIWVSQELTSACTRWTNTLAYLFLFGNDKEKSVKTIKNRLIPNKKFKCKFYHSVRKLERLTAKRNNFKMFFKGANTLAYFPITIEGWMINKLRSTFTYSLYKLDR